MTISQLALAAKRVIEAAWLNGSSYDLATQAAEALQSAQLLQSPETAAERNCLAMAVMFALQWKEDAPIGLRQGIEEILTMMPDTEEKSSRDQAADATPVSFFQPGRMYTRDAPFRAPEDRPNFICVGVGVHPTKAHPRAFGFEQAGAGQSWSSAAQRPEEWTEGWIDLGSVQPDRLTRIFAAVQALRVEEPTDTGAPTLTVYRATWDVVPLDTYTTEAEARKHAEDHARRDLPTATFDWIVDPEDGISELVATVDGQERPIGYTVTALEIAAKYDPEAEE
ncbi:hypothetical protein [Streptomyces arenae]|uniref:hypothetical protein n=1 Tax=Streptomyces arenae TaxID=29301 RepID=UPI002659C98C|nr:hypothetical protein [Streptomyces arenae]MCG7204006.1 hypothetical protein [Streptomyces arenae]